MKLLPSQIIAGLVARGVPEHVAKGVAMNFRDESAFETGAQEQGGGGFGLAQWTGPRRANLENYARAQGKPVGDPDLQLDFFMQENQGPEKAAWQKVLAAPTTQQAAVAFVNEWERPAAQHAASRSAAYAGAADSPSEAGGARFGGTGLAPLPPMETPPIVTAEPTKQEPMLRGEDNPWASLASGLGSSVKGGNRAAQQMAFEAASGIAAPPEFESALPAPAPDMAPIATDFAAPGEAPGSELAGLFKVDPAGIGQAAAMNIDKMGNPIRRRTYG
jgi:hypothetical protein